MSQGGKYRRTRAPRRGTRPGEDGAATAAAARRDAARRANLPRRTAYDVLAAVRERAAYANLLLPKLLAERGLDGRDAALATELAYGTLRGPGPDDAGLTAVSDRPLATLDPPGLDGLRLGTHQLLSTRVGAHAAVATSVDLAKAVIGPKVSGYANAVLRRVATRDLDAWLPIVAPDPAADPDGYLAVRHSHPRWIVAAYRAALGGSADAELDQALEAGNARPRVTMATFPSGAPRMDVIPADAEPGRWSPYAFTLASGDPAPLIESGAAAVQDEGSQLAAIALSRAPLVPRASTDGAGTGDAGTAERWLDMCAGPGGKARLLLGLAFLAGRAKGEEGGGGVALTAAELHPHRAALVAEALAAAPKRGRGPYEVVVADSTKPPWPDASFDRVLLDVPCSGLGALRRRPEARWRKSEADLKELTALQRDLLRSALRAVRPGGVVAYVTCTPVPAETSEVVADVTASLPDVELLDTPAALPDVPDAAAAADPRFAQLWPHRHGTDAIFIALLRRGLS